ncbi:pimeloyl-ACP methyl ester carboxylesterase [Virgibacillus halotolerans]|uniref:alpha/beta fold hydrolase n=1 Tax=Virgibacillus halotolerans TaxID=1071053 RepID=UPI001960082C|nr:alpha/beta hydrolase [Virgibacillus halotolerans]MBM7601102.1 pimeloyl-ACP methyl ester carboxylesterase [Virgibacillus halotolerans]
MKKVVITGIITLIIALLVCSYFYTNITYIKKPLKEMYKAGFTEKQMKLKDGTILNYGEGPSNGKIPLLLIHGQGMNWEDYAKVLPGLSKHYHVYAVDCHGHGESDWNPEKYKAKVMAADFAEFIEVEIGEKTVVSGHSSGGMIAAWMAAHYRELVLGTVIEDSPFFSTELDRRENTYVWVYGFQMYEDFKNQDEVKDYFVYSLKNSYWRNMFGDFLWNKFSKDAISYHEKHPNEPVHLVYLPPQINRMFEAETYPFDRKFGETFYDNTWFEGYNQAEVLSKIKSPTVFLKANTTYDGNLLVAALSDEDADRVVELLECGIRIDIDTPGHDIHYDKPKEFTDTLVRFLEDKQ